MIIACPACGTKYVVPDDALGAEGRTVRCAKCKHNWFQEGPEIALPERDTAEAPPPMPPTVQPPAEAVAADAGAAPAQEAASDPEPEPAAPARPAEKRRIADEVADPPLPDALVTPPPFYRAADNIPAERKPAATQDEDDYSSFDYQPPFTPKRNRGRLLTIGAAAFAAIALLLIAAIQIWGLPSWLPGSDPMFAGEEPGLTMNFPAEEQQTRTTTDGAEYLAISGTISNTSSETRAVPSILVVLRDSRDRVVFSQEIASPKPQLAPGETQSIDTAIADIPQSATDAEFGWAPR